MSKKEKVIIWSTKVFFFREFIIKSIDAYSSLRYFISNEILDLVHNRSPTRIHICSKSEALSRIIRFKHIADDIFYVVSRVISQ